jgi:hypothetical protein
MRRGLKTRRRRVIEAANEAMIPTTAKAESGGVIRYDYSGYHWPANINSKVGAPLVSREKWQNVFQCAEPKLVNTMVNMGIEKSTISISTFGIKAGMQYTGQGFNFMGGRNIYPKAPCTNCAITLKGVKRIN